MISRCDENSGTFEGVSNVILGVGIDAVEISRVQKSCEKEHFQNRVFTAAEIGQFDKRKVRAASDFAGKEAVVKVLGTGFSGCGPRDIEIFRDEKGAPFVKLYGGAKKLAADQGIMSIRISITNTSELAMAFAVGSDEPGGEGLF